MKRMLFILLAFPFLSFAGTLQCSGTVDKIGLHAPDRVMLKLSSMNKAVFICNTNAEWSVSGTPYTTSAQTCNALLSMLLYAKSTNTDMGHVWFDGNDVPTSCNGWEDWKSANIRHFLY
ncbi:hypothetical protein [Pseudoalteromonas sp. R3]|uniref:hypothetical protein n=1 Tax=Pseudoalteromonas sp. R3 TaxID=1709477 RepID=UPI0006B60CCC|nr:hypothetical protein [Pseudoalteromonas sp. R3]AZZ95774.1 hypothetical protein ELR70_00750 [Pseudoalteromonas sp. R3]